MGGLVVFLREKCCLLENARLSEEILQAHKGHLRRFNKILNGIQVDIIVVL